MPVLLLRRDAPLTDAERARLPAGAASVNEPGGVIARLTVDGEPSRVISAAVALARAVPDAEFVVRVPATEASVGGLAGVAGVAAAPVVSDSPAQAEEGAAEGAAPAEAAEQDFVDPWVALDRGERDRAMRRFAAVPLTGDGRERVRRMVLSANPVEVIDALRIARVTDFKSFFSSARRVSDHSDPAVRAEAALAIGTLAGFSQLTLLEKMLKDADASVRESAKQAISLINTRRG
ncbi:hypothetical protein L6R46_22090 [Myxococcota bacterium]|jgi:hypothetical protein|nr:hypothetical protein [Myxococcota bacterium]